MATASGDKNTTIKAAIDDIKRATDRLAASSKEAAAEARRLAQEYTQGLNSTTATQAFDQYGIAIAAVEKNIENYQKSIEKLIAERNKLNDIEGENAKLYNQLTSRISSYTNALNRERDTLIALKEEQQQYSKETLAAAEAEKEAAAAAELAAQKSEKLKKAQSALSKTLKLSIAIVTALVAALKRMTSSEIENGTELYSLSIRYGATAEEIQKTNRALQLATGQTDLFTNSLAVLAKGMSDIAGGRGQKYTKALRAIGLSYKELSEQTKSDQFRNIVEGLMSLENETQRAAHAQTLLGESGQYLVGALANSDKSLQDYINDAEKFSYITNKNAESLAYMGIRLDALKSQIAVSEAQLVLDLEPAITAVLDLINKAVPLINKLIGNGWGLYAVIFAILALKVTSTFLSWRLELLKVSATAGAAATKLVFLKAVAGGIAAAGIAVAGAFALAAATSKKMEENVDNTYDKMQQLNTQSGTYNANVESYTTQSTERTINMSVDMYGHGDTTVSDEAAQTVAQLTADELQKRWGDLVK